jgi:hypothetical protein
MGSGSDFHIVIPVDVGALPDTAPAVDRGRVLIACGDERRAADLMQTVRRIGGESICVTTGGDLVRELERAAPDILVLCATVPGLGSSGWAAAAARAQSAIVYLKPLASAPRADVPASAVILAEPARESRLTEVVIQLCAQSAGRALRR